MNNPYFHSRKQDFPNLRTFSLASKQKQMDERQNLTTVQIGTVGLNNQFLMSRRQNYLNSGYNIRRQKLQDITTQNKKIYMKINSQKSSYSRQSLRKSYESNASLVKRLSQSKISRKLMSSRISRASLTSSQCKKNTKVSKQKKKYHIQTSSIQQITNQQLTKFQTIFKSNAQNLVPINITRTEKKKSLSRPIITPNRLKIPRRTSISSNDAQSKAQFQTQTQTLTKTLTQTHTQAQRISLPLIKRPPPGPKQKFKSQLKMMTHAKRNQGAFLHVIAEQMFGRMAVPK